MTEKRLVGWQPESGEQPATWHVRILGMLATACGRESRYRNGVKYPPEGTLLCPACLAAWQRRAIEAGMEESLVEELATVRRLLSAPGGAVRSSRPD